jgi:hypothetical protein
MVGSGVGRADVYLAIDDGQQGLDSGDGRHSAAGKSKLVELTVTRYAARIEFIEAACRR